MTPTEWDAERDRRAKILLHNVPSLNTSPSWLAEMTMETPRPAEPPCVTRGEWTITHTGERFVAVHPRVGAHVSTDAACIAAELVITVAEKLTLDLIALRDGPLPQYEVCVGFRGYSGEPLYRQVTP